MAPADQNNSAPALVLGIDTGGTYTDAVLLDLETRQVVAYEKRLTTHWDLVLGIEQVMAAISLPEPAAVRLVAVSTTLATNAIVEGGDGAGGARPVALLLLGYDPELVKAFQMESRFATPYFRYLAGGHDLYGLEQAPLDPETVVAAVASLPKEVEAVAVSGYFSPLNAAHEMQAYEVLSHAFDLPIVLGHRLSTRLNSVERATTAALNASLLGVLQEFMGAVSLALTRRGITAPIMVVRGDGTLMDAKRAAQRPVETIHSGPAASAVGGRFLTGLEDVLVVDVGGTTTDLALVEGGHVAVDEAGATVAGYQTAVTAANLRTIGLGGDSHIRIDGKQALAIGPQRVVPLAYLAQRFPQVRQDLAAAVGRSWSPTAVERLTFWYLERKPPPGLALQPQEVAVIELLEEGPRPLPEILDRLGLFHVSQLGVKALLRRRIIGQAGLTPTDLMHADGRFVRWDQEAASLAVNAVCHSLRQDPARFQANVWRQITEVIVEATVSFLSGRPVPSPEMPKSSSGRWFFENSLYDRHPHLETRLRLRLPIVGIGAPAGVFLPAVAEALHTELILPAHHEVANAVGAVAGSVLATEEVLVYPRLSAEGYEVLSYFVQGADGRDECLTLDKALDRARETGSAKAQAAALAAGAVEPQLEATETAEGIDSYRVKVRAVGSPRLDR